jgi:hypothetical protein
VNKNKKSLDILDIFFLFRWVRNRGSGTNLCTDLLFSHSASIFMFPEKDNRNAPTPSDQELLEGKETLEARENPFSSLPPGTSVIADA